MLRPHKFSLGNGGIRVDKRRRQRRPILGGLYSTAGLLTAAAVTALFIGNYLVWVIGLLVAVKLLLTAYWVRTGRYPWRRDDW